MLLVQKINLLSVLSGDNRLSTRLQQSELLPIASRIRSRRRHEHASPEQLFETQSTRCRLSDTS